jgi:alpha-L-fucosidase
MTLLPIALFASLVLPTTTLDSLPDRTIIPLLGETHHVQGIAVRQDRLWVTAVDRTTRKGFLFEYELPAGRQLRSLQIQQEALFHPGGISISGDSLYVPVAEYRRDGRSTIERRSLATLQVQQHFEVDDHIGAIAAGNGRLYGANWDARQIYEWTPDGKLLRKRDNPYAAKYQDMKFVDGNLVAAGPGVIHWLNPETLAVEREITTGKTDRGVPYTNEGMEIAGGRLYLLPEDAPSRLFAYNLQAANPGNKPERLEWFRDLGFGMFIHWNVDVTLGSVISHSLVGASPDYVERYYTVLPRYFDPKRFDPQEWARLAKLAGMKYAVLTTKHHSGFCLWDTKTTPFNVMNTPFHRDVVRGYVDAFRAEGIAIGVYISPDDFWWFYKNGYPIARPPAPRTTTKELPGMLEHDKQQLRELLGGTYGKIDILFIDGPPDGVREEAWRINPDIVVTRGAIETPEQYVPGIPMDQPWEGNMTVGTAWQHKPADVAKPSTQLIETLIDIRAKGGNFLLNVGPQADGTLSEQEDGRLRDMGLWNFVNGESMNAVRPWVITNEGNVWFTRRKNEPTLYAFVTRAPWKLGEQRTITIKSARATQNTQVSVLGQSGEILEYRPDVIPRTTFTQDQDGLHITATTAQRMYDDRKWSNPVVLKITNVEPALKPPVVLTLASQSGELRGELRSLGDAKDVEVGFEYRARKGMTDLYERDDPWKPLPLEKRTVPGSFTGRLPAGVRADDQEFRSVVKHPLLTLYGTERPVR